jgi:hypothetical protein
MQKPLRRPAFRARIQWHTWMPWYEFSRIAGEMQEHDERAGGMLPLTLGLALVTLVAAMFVPQLSLLITVAGGGSIVAALTWGSGDGRRLLRGVKVVGLPSPRTFLALSAEMAAADVRALWHGRPQPSSLLAGPDEEGWTREETIGRYHLWCQVRESLPPAGRDAAAIAAAMGVAPEALMDALLAHKLRLADLNGAETGHVGYLPSTLEGTLLDRAGPRLLALPAPHDGGTDSGQHATAVQTGHAGGDVAVPHRGHTATGDERVRADDERHGRRRVGTRRRVSSLVARCHSLGGRQYDRRASDLEAAHGLTLTEPGTTTGCPAIGDGGRGDG